MELVGWLLVAGFVAFMMGAGAWRLEYEQPLEKSLPFMHGDVRRLRWIHWWMVPAVFLTVAGLGGLAWLVADAGAAVAAAGYALGAAFWVLALLFRLTVGEWAAEQAAATGEIPAMYPSLARWMGLGHGAHMMSAYVTAIPLAVALVGADLIPSWLGWAGGIWGVTLAVAMLIPRVSFIASPPFWAHLFTFAIGLALLL